MGRSGGSFRPRSPAESGLGCRRVSSSWIVKSLRLQTHLLTSSPPRLGACALWAPRGERSQWRRSLIRLQDCSPKKMRSPNPGPQLRRCDPAGAPRGCEGLRSRWGCEGLSRAGAAVVARLLIPAWASVAPRPPGLRRRTRASVPMLRSRTEVTFHFGSFSTVRHRRVQAIGSSLKMQIVSGSGGIGLAWRTPYRYHRGGGSDFLQI